MNYWFALVLGLLPSVAWLIFFLQEDRQRPEPKKLILETFLLGAAATFFVLQIQIVINNWLIGIGIAQWTPLSIFWLAAIEEVAKFLVVYFFIHKNRNFDEAIDPMIYMVVAALGFAAVENIASAIKATNSFELLTLRFVGATLLHSLSSGLVGYWWSLSIYHKRHHISDILVGLFYAIIFHSVFNFLIVKLGPGISVTLVLIFAAFFVLNDFEHLKTVSIPLPEDNK